MTLAQTNKELALHLGVHCAVPEATRPRWKPACYFHNRVVDNLGQRRREVLKHFAEGMCPKEIAEHIHVSPKTVEYYFNHPQSGIYRLLGISKPALLVQWALRHGLADWKV